jgi:thioredoxin reductase (NADPH)
MKNENIFVVGGGPAGVAASVYLRRFSHEVAIIEPNPMLGGQVMIPHIIENYLGFPNGINGFQFATILHQHVQDLRIPIVNQKVTEIKNEGKNQFTINLNNKKTLFANYVICGIGTKNRPLNIPGEKEWTGKGVSTCGTCDGPLFKNKTIAVIGGGDTALTETLFLSSYAKSIHLFHRRDAFRGFDLLVRKIQDIPTIQIHYSSIPVEIHGNETVHSITYKNLTTDQIFKIPVDGVFVFAGYIPDTCICQDIVDIDDKGYIKVNAEKETKTPGFYAVGDIVSKSLRQIVTAMNDGAIAANHIHHEILNATM